MSGELLECHDLIRDLFDDLVESDECCSSWMVEKYADRLSSLGIDVGDTGRDRLMNRIEFVGSMYEQVTRPDYEYGSYAAQKYGEEKEELRRVARVMGWEVSE